MDVWKKKMNNRLRELLIPYLAMFTAELKKAQIDRENLK